MGLGARHGRGSRGGTSNSNPNPNPNPNPSSNPNPNPNPIPNPNQARPALLPLSLGVQLRSLCCAHEATFALTVDGDVYHWGVAWLGTADPIPFLTLTLSLSLS